MRRRIAAFGLGLGLACRPAPAFDAPVELVVADTEVTEASEAIGFAEAPCVRSMVHVTGARSVPVPSVDVHAYVEGPVAHTTLTLAVGNTGLRDEEVVLSFVLPEGAVVRDLQLDVDGQWQPSRILERGEARRTYDSIVHRRDDPAIAEREDPERIEVRVFPVLPQRDRRVRLSWVQALVREGAPLEVPLCGLSAIGTLTVSLEDRAPNGLVRHERSWSDVTPRSMLVASLSEGRPPAIRQGDWVVARMQADDDTRPDRLEAFTLLVDTSASRATTFGRDLEALKAVVAALAEREPGIALRVIAFDQRVSVIYEGRVDGFDVAAERLRRRRALGATDIERALTRTLELGRGSRLIVVSDGIATLGDRDTSVGHGLARRLGAAGIARVDVLGAFGQGNVLGRVATQSDRPGRIMPLTSDAGEIAAVLQRATAVATIEVPGAHFVSPERWVAAQGSTILLARLDAGVVWQARLEGARLQAPPRVAESEVELAAPLVGAARLSTIERRLADLSTDDERRPAEIHAAVAVAQEHQLLSRYTARLALESEEMWSSELPGLSPQGSVDEMMSRMNPEARRLEALHREQEAIMASYMQALERWAAARARGEPVGPRPSHDDFLRADRKRRRERLGERLRELSTRDRVDGPYAEVMRALARGAIETAEDRAEAWFANNPGSPLSAIAGGRVAAAAGRHEVAARWFGTTVELLDESHPLYGSGVYLMNATTSDARELDLLLARQAARKPVRSSVLRGIAALARNEAAVAAKHFDVALALVERGEPSPELRALLAMANAARLASEGSARRKRDLAGASTQPGWAIVLVASGAHAARTGILIDRNPEVLHANALDLDRARHSLESVHLHVADGQIGPEQRAVVWTPADVDDRSPVVGAVYVVGHDGHGAVSVQHHPFVLTVGHATLDVPM